MIFKVDNFVDAKFVPRTEFVEVKELAEFFEIEDGQKPGFLVRGLKGHELLTSKEAGKRSKDLQTIVESSLDGQAGKIADAIKEYYELSSKDEISVRVQMFIYGVVEPEMTASQKKDVAIRIAERFPVDFYYITNVIQKLTGAGHVPGKPQSSGKTKQSKQT